MSILEVNTINPQSGNDVTIGGSSKNVKFASGTTVDFSTNTPTLTLGAAMKNTPAFEAHASANLTSVADVTWTKCTMNTERFDSDSMYDASTNYRFTPTIAGKYCVYGMCSMYSETDYKLNVANLAIYKNGSIYKTTNDTFDPSYEPNECSPSISVIIDFNGSSDYVELYVRSNVTSGTSTIDIDSLSGAFGAYRILGA